MSLTPFESLEEEAAGYGIEVDEGVLQADDPLDGLCVKRDETDTPLILLNKHRPLSARYVALAEELGHYHKSVGNIIDQSSVISRKSENAGRAHSYERIASPEGIRNLLLKGWFGFYEIAEELGVTVDCLTEAMEYYQRKGISLSTLEPDKPDDIAESCHSTNDLQPQRRAALMKLIRDSAVGPLPKFIAEVCDERQEESAQGYFDG